MAFQGPGVANARRIPTFKDGYATYLASERQDWWRGLTLAWAPFLGPGPPAFQSWGRGVRRGQIVSTGGSISFTRLGTAWHFPGTADKIDFGPIDNFMGLSKGTVILGMTKNVVSFQAAGTWGTAVYATQGLGTSPSAVGALAPFVDGNTYFDFGGSTVGTSRVQVNTSTHTWQESHVLAFTVGPLGMWVYCDGRIIGGHTTVPSARPAAPTEHMLFGKDVQGQGQNDGNNTSFFYVWDQQLSPSAIEEISADPHALFRPRARAVMSTTAAPTVVNITITATGAGSLTGQLMAFAQLGIGASGAGALTGQLVGRTPVVIGAAGTGALSGAMTGLAQAIITAAGAGALTGQPMGFAQLHVGATGGSVAIMSFDVTALRGIQGFLIVDAVTGLPVTGATGGMTFEYYADDLGGAAPAVPIVTEIGGGCYKFYPQFPASDDRGVVYMLNTGAGHRPLRVYGYLRPTDEAEDDLPTLAQRELGGWRIFTTGPDADRLVVYDADGTTPLAKFPLRDLVGAPSATAPSQVGPTL